MNSVKLLLSIILIGGVCFIGCDKSTGPSTDSSVLYEDAAEAISAAVGDQSGGATESFADVMIAGGGGSMAFASPVMDGGDLVTAGVPVYDPSTGWWSVSVSRSLDNAMMQRAITREYRYQFQKNGTAQMNFVTGSDTATALKFRIVSGTGILKTARLSHTLTQLKGAWTSSNINKDTVTITLDSTYVRSAVDTIKTRNMLRTHTGTLTLTSVNIKAPRYRPLLVTLWRANFPQAISGTVSGNYSATITKKNEAPLTISRDFTITVGGGNGSLSLNGGRYNIDMNAGQRNP